VKQVKKKETEVKKRKEENKEEEIGCRKTALMQDTVFTLRRRVWQML